MHKLTVIGLTGNIASGKTSILSLIKRAKIPTHDSDLLVTRVYKKPPKKFIQLVKKMGLGEAVKGNKINKDVFREGVLKDDKKLKKLESYLHKKVKISRENFIKRNKKLKKNLVVLDIPLLFEKKLQSICDYIIYVYCPVKIRMKRALKRKRMSKKILLKFIKLQLPDREKMRKSNFIIDTSKTAKSTQRQTKEAINKIKILCNR